MTGSSAARHIHPYRALAFLFALMLLGAVPRLHAQNGYEIQVYPSETIPPKVLLVELHSNYTVEGSTTVQYGMLPTQGQEHETIELTQGLNKWSEVGFYIFTAERNGNGVQWVGDHIRPRVRAPESWHLPVGLSLSNEIGYARPEFANPTWSWQINPIVDQTLGKWYWSVNGNFNWGHPVPPPANYTPAQRTVYYRDVSPGGLTFSPAATVTFQPSKYYNVGIEYYGYYGEFGNFVSLHNQQQQFFPVFNFFFSKKWEVNVGAGWGATAATDHLVVKGIVGRYFDWGGRHKAAAHAPFQP